MKLFSSKQAEQNKTSPNRLVAAAFDKAYYLATNPDVAKSDVDPLQHYLSQGWKEGRSPFEGFDNAYYLSTHLAQNPGDLSPLEHYVMYGKDLGLDIQALPLSEVEKPNPEKPNPLAKVYQEAIHDSGSLDNFVGLLAMLGLDTSYFSGRLSIKLLPIMFSAEHYRKEKNLDVTISDNECFIRYICFDLPQGMSPGPMFDEAYYREQLQKNKITTLDPEVGAFRHWIEVGLGMSISPTPIFDPEQYLKFNQDLKNYPGILFEHFLMHGLVEKRKFLDNFTFVGHSLERYDKTARGPVDAAFRELVNRKGAQDEIERMHSFRTSDLFQELCSQAVKLDPAIGAIDPRIPSYVAHWHDADYQDFRIISRKIPKNKYSTIILMPFCKMGGADLVGSVVAQNADDPENILILRTDQSDWTQPDWFPDGVDSVDLSQELNGIPKHIRMRVLYELIICLGANSVYNVNSRAGLDMFKEYGQRLALVSDLYAYFFCADIDNKGYETGYPVHFFAPIFSGLKAALIDTQYLADVLSDRFAVSSRLQNKIQVLYTPALNEIRDVPIAVEQVENRRERTRPKIIWAGRFDRQKRFDLFCDIAREMPEVDFECYGKAVLDAPPDLSSLPENIHINGPFTSYDDLNLTEADGWLYTSAWDGLPTILIELGALGVPIVASAVGGVPELINDQTGWPIEEDADINNYVDAINDMISSPEQRCSRAAKLQELVSERHSNQAYRKALRTMKTKA